ncbi:YceI family protein [Flammeovirga agarivorans]|uniref:YceI family protein n=1 Tax=Flammeovirga agarivorans TaxID=2726742 RepID=A0A7X8SLX3_9BACT|nr:YceI family protein [Flammeovirga agarivorans]NLR92557.1 YceI family protein [Flammeovirga agarivorans]
MKNLAKGLIGILLLSAVACSSPSNSSKEETSNKKEVATESASYSYDAAATQVAFTAFKTTDKVPVGGKFMQFEATPAEASVSNPIDILNNLKFSIPVSSIETNDKGRNGKIVKYFFGTLASTENISGVIKSVSNGKALVSITMNNITKDVELTAKASDNVVLVKGAIDVANWDGIGAIDALNKICYDLHKGADGKSKLWSEVDLVIKSKLASN